MFDKISAGFLDVYEYYHSSWLRNRALKECYDHIRADDSFTNGISIGPVSILGYVIGNLYTSFEKFVLWGGGGGVGGSTVIGC